MIQRADIVEEARTWLGTRWHHQGRLKRSAHSPGGVDCIGVPIAIGLHFGVPYVEGPAYPRYAPDLLLPSLRRFMNEIPMADAKDGAVLVFHIADTRFPQHTAIKTPQGMIHAYMDVRKVVEHGIDEYWLTRMTNAFDFPGVVD